MLLMFIIVKLTKYFLTVNTLLISFNSQTKSLVAEKRSIYDKNNTNHTFDLKSPNELFAYMFDFMHDVYGRIPSPEPPTIDPFSYFDNEQPPPPVDDPFLYFDEPQPLYPNEQPPPPLDDPFFYYDMYAQPQTLYEQELDIYKQMEEHRRFFSSSS